MEALFVNHEHQLSAEVHFVNRTRYRVVYRDLDADAVLHTRFFPTRELAVASAKAFAAQAAA